MKRAFRRSHLVHVYVTEHKRLNLYRWTSTGWDPLHKISVTLGTESFRPVWIYPFCSTNYLEYVTVYIFFYLIPRRRRFLNLNTLHVGGTLEVYFRKKSVAIFSIRIFLLRDYNCILNNKQKNRNFLIMFTLYFMSGTKKFLNKTGVQVGKRKAFKMKGKNT